MSPGISFLLKCVFAVRQDMVYCTLGGIAKRAAGFIRVAPEFEHIWCLHRVYHGIQDECYYFGAGAIDQVFPAEVKRIHVLFPTGPNTLKG